MTRIKVLIITYHFFPDYAVGAKRTSELALSLASAGYDPHIVTAGLEADQQDDACLAERVKALPVTRVPVPGKLTPWLASWLKRRRRSLDSLYIQSPIPSVASQSQESTQARIRRYYHSLEWLIDDKKLWTFRVICHLILMRFRGNFQAVISSGPPMSPHLAAWFAKWLFGAQWLIDLRDPWVGNDIWPSYVRSALSVRAEAVAERRCLRAADRIVCTSIGTAKDIGLRHPGVAEKLSVIMNGYDTTLQLQPATRSGVLSMLYAGSLYYNRNPFPLLEALVALVETPNVSRDKVSLVLVGDCAQWGGIDLKSWVKERGLEAHVRIEGRVGRAELSMFMAQANVLVNFAQGQPNQIPAKMFEYMSSGREMLVIAEPDSDSAVLVQATRTGRVVDMSDPNEPLRTLKALYKAYVVEQQQYEPSTEALSRFSRPAQNKIYVETIASVCGVPRSACAETSCRKNTP